MNKRMMLDVLSDGKPKTTLQIIQELKLNCDGKQKNTIKVIMYKMYKRGDICEVLPRVGREKIWKITTIAAREIDPDIPCIVDASHGIVMFSGITKPDQFLFPIDRKDVMLQSMQMAMESLKCQRCNDPVAKKWNYCPKCSFDLKHGRIE